MTTYLYYNIIMNLVPSYIFYIVRRMFPTVRISFRNVPDLGKFLVLLDIIPCDNKRYRYVQTVAKIQKEWPLPSEKEMIKTFYNIYIMK